MHSQICKRVKRTAKVWFSVIICSRLNKLCDQTNLVLKCVCFPNRVGQNSDLTDFTSKIQAFCRPDWTKGWTPWKWIRYFSATKVNITNSSESRWKNGVISLVTFLPSWIMVLKLPKIVHILQICADLSNKSKSSKSTYLYLSEIERPHHAISENSMFLGVWAAVHHKISRNKTSKKSWLGRNLTKSISDDNIF